MQARIQGQVTVKDRMHLKLFQILQCVEGASVHFTITNDCRKLHMDEQQQCTVRSLDNPVIAAAIPANSRKLPSKKGIEWL